MPAPVAVLCFSLSLSWRNINSGDFFADNGRRPIGQISVKSLH